MFIKYPVKRTISTTREVVLYTNHNNIRQRSKFIIANKFVMQTILLTMLVKHVQSTSVELGREITNFLIFVLENKFPTRRKKITSLLRSNRIQIMTGAEYRYEKRFFDTLYFFFLRVCTTWACENVLPTEHHLLANG